MQRVREGSKDNHILRGGTFKTKFRTKRIRAPLVLNLRLKTLRGGRRGGIRGKVPRHY